MQTPKTSYKTIDEYISLYPVDIQKILARIRKVIKDEVPEATEAISYQIPTFKLNGKNLVHFAAFKDHISFFPTSSPIEIFKKELKPYKTSKGTIQFPFGQPLPFQLIQKIVQFRVKEILGKA